MNLKYIIPYINIHTEEPLHNVFIEMEYLINVGLIDVYSNSTGFELHLKNINDLV